MDHLNSIVEQIRTAAQPKNRLALVCGILLGGFIPCATFFVAHVDTLVSPLYWVLVAGGLLFSAKTVYDWTTIAFQSVPKAIGFCIICEGIMTSSTIPALAYVALAVLALVNGIATGCTIALKQKQYCNQRSNDRRTTRPKPLNLRSAPQVPAKQTTLVS